LTRLLNLVGGEVKHCLSRGGSSGRREIFVPSKRSKVRS